MRENADFLQELVLVVGRRVISVDSAHISRIEGNPNLPKLCRLQGPQVEVDSLIAVAGGEEVLPELEKRLARQLPTRFVPTLKPGYMPLCDRMLPLHPRLSQVWSPYWVRKYVH